MKRISIVFWVTLLSAVPALAVNSADFSTRQGAAFSWQLQNVGGSWQMSFVNDATVVDSSNPADATLLSDFVNLPTMVFSDISVIAPGVLMATLTPVGDFTIQADAAGDGVSAGDTVLTASMAPSTFLTGGANFMAYSAVVDDLDILSFADGYGTVIPLLAADEAAGGFIDINFSGNSSGSTDLFALLTGSDLGRTATGNTCGGLSGIPGAVPIPAPCALLLTAIGTLLTGWLRQRTFA